MNQLNHHDEPIEIADGVFWVGFYEERVGLHCNPYLIIEGDEAILFDGGSRNDFSDVMIKILQTGISPESIKHLVYHHYDPDLCGSIPHLENIVGDDDLKIISHHDNNVFIRFYCVRSPLLCVSTMNFEFKFSSGRRIRFIPTPYAHCGGSFVSFDEKTGVLLSSDLFGHYGAEDDLLPTFDDACHHCDFNSCAINATACRIRRILQFHQRMMPSEKALRHAMNQIKDLPIEIIAPQHGGVISNPNDAQLLIKSLHSLKGVGIDNADYAVQ